MSDELKALLGKWILLVFVMLGHTPEHFTLKEREELAELTAAIRAELEK